MHDSIDIFDGIRYNSIIARCLSSVAFQINDSLKYSLIPTHLRLTPNEDYTKRSKSAENVTLASAYWNRNLTQQKCMKSCWEWAKRCRLEANSCRIKIGNSSCECAQQWSWKLFIKFASAREKKTTRLSIYSIVTPNSDEVRAMQSDRLMVCVATLVSCILYWKYALICIWENCKHG